ncbi:hypothetical protein EJ110_NYTH32449 [Nymphaea thermarum]|nr:hypothetical protein EJ110_NYTH32449 [Nymphaea thermarum]
MAARWCLPLLVLALLCVAASGADAPASGPSPPQPGSSGGLPKHRASERVQVEPRDAAGVMSGRRFGGHEAGDRSFLGGCAILAGLAVTAAVVIFCYIRVTRTPSTCPCKQPPDPDLPSPFLVLSFSSFYCISDYCGHHCVCPVVVRYPDEKRLPETIRYWQRRQSCIRCRRRSRNTILHPRSRKSNERYDYEKQYASKSFFDSSKARRVVWAWPNGSDDVPSESVTYRRAGQGFGYLSAGVSVPSSMVQRSFPFKSFFP